MLNFSYKENIQFLRALSVLLVFFYHLKLDFFNKGYLGVDIFFVISGYVITQSIFFNINKENSFNLAYFFRKRVLRIIPNLIFILTVVFIFFQFYGPNNLSLWNDYVSSIFGFSNLYYLFSNKGYFYNIFDNPFAHTWSLGVEEQFYFLFPLLIFFIFKKIKKFKENLKIFKILLFVIIFISLFLSIYYSFNNSDLNFYFSPLRFWELGAGCILFIFDNKIPKNRFIFNFSFISLILIVLIDFKIPYILNNLLVIIFTGIFITTSKKKIFLSNNLSLFLGKISYSFYLWHLPIIFFLNLYYEDLSIQITLSFLISLILSALTFKFIEKPFIELNNTIKNNTIKKILIFISTLIVFGFIFLIYIKITNNNIRYEVRNFINNNNYLEKKHEWKKKVTFQQIFIGKNEIHESCDDMNTVNHELRLNEKCLKKINNKYLIFIEGDSHTAQFVNPINNNKNIKNLYFSFAPQKFASTKLVEKISTEFDVIFYLRDVNNLENLDYILKSDLSKIKNLNFLFFNSTPFLGKKIHPQRCLSRQTDCYFEKKIDIEKRELNQLNTKLNELSNTYKNIFIFDSYNTICPENYCKVYDKNKDILYYMDNNHLSNQGSQILQNEIDLFFKKKIMINNLN